MKLGLQKTTLLDYPGKVACTIFFPGCNFRCPYCQNAALVLPAEELTEEGRQMLALEGYLPSNTPEDILAFLQKRRGILEGVCLTGGEPTLQKDLMEYIRKIKDMGYLIKLDTNGTNPAMLENLYQEGLLDMVAMDLKSSREGYARACGRPLASSVCANSLLSIAPIQKTIDFLLSGKIAYEFRTTLVRGIHTEEDIRSMAKWIAGAKAYYLQSYTDSESILYKLQKPAAHRLLSSSAIPSALNLPDNHAAETICQAFDKDTLQHFLQIVRTYVPHARLRGID